MQTGSPLLSPKKSHRKSDIGFKLNPDRFLCSQSRVRCVIHRPTRRRPLSAGAGCDRTGCCCGVCPCVTSRRSATSRAAPGGAPARACASWQRRRDPGICSVTGNAIFSACGRVCLRPSAHPGCAWPSGEASRGCGGGGGCRCGCGTCSSSASCTSQRGSAGCCSFMEKRENVKTSLPQGENQ